MRDREQFNKLASVASGIFLVSAGIGTVFPETSRVALPVLIVSGVTNLALVVRESRNGKKDNK